MPPARKGIEKTWEDIVHSLGRVLSGLSLYAAPCLSGGAVAAMLHKLLELDLKMAIVIGVAAPIGPMYMIYATGWGMRRTLAQIKEWQTVELIDEEEAAKMRDRAIDWYIKRRF